METSKEKQLCYYKKFNEIMSLIEDQILELEDISENTELMTLGGFSSKQTYAELHSLYRLHHVLSKYLEHNTHIAKEMVGDIFF